MKKRRKKENEKLKKLVMFWEWMKPGLFILLFAALPILLKYTTPMSSNALNGKPTQNDYDLLQEDLNVIMPIVHQKNPQFMIQEMATLLENRKPAANQSLSKLNHKTKKTGEQAELAGKNLNIEIDSQNKPLDVEAVSDNLN